MYLDTWFVTEVWYCDQEGWETWMVTPKSIEGDYLQESDYYHHKADAVYAARGYLESGRCSRLIVEKKNGEVHYTETSKAEGSKAI
jgi:hypothetical protein